MAVTDPPGQDDDGGPVIIKLEGELSEQWSALARALDKSEKDVGSSDVHVTLTESNLSGLAPLMESALEKGVSIHLHRDA